MCIISLGISLLINSVNTCLMNALAKPAFSYQQDGISLQINSVNNSLMEDIVNHALILRIPSVGMILLAQPTVTLYSQQHRVRTGLKE